MFITTIIPTWLPMYNTNMNKYFVLISSVRLFVFKLQQNVVNLMMYILA